MDPQSPLVTSYDRVAATYTKQVAGELAGKPLDRALLWVLVEQVGKRGPIYDLGCGPGHVADFLAHAGATVHGIDVSCGMIEQARHRLPNIVFEQGDMRAIPTPDGSVGGIVAFYCIIHLDPSELDSTFREWWRVLIADGLVLVAFHLGDEVVHPDELWGHPVDIDFHFLQLDAVAAALRRAGFMVEATLRRAPYEGVEHPSERGYILARKTA
jgi:SAM-dependent methyltransferase